VWLEPGGYRLIFRNWKHLSNAVAVLDTSGLKQKYLMPHTGHASCKVCGAVLEFWLESIHFGTFELVKRPDRKPQLSPHPKH
jgi:hypothetical protein